MKKTSPWSIVFLSLVLLVMYLPIVVVIVYSFNANTARIPIAFTGWSTQWYEALFSGRSGYFDALALSVQVAIGSVLLSCAIGTLGAIGMAQRTLVQRMKASKPDSIIETMVTLPIMIPEIILGLAFMSIFNAVGIAGNELRLILSHTTFCIPYVYLTVKSRMVGMDTALFDAARDLGASPFRVMKDITIPLCMPAIISGGFLAFAMSMDDFVISFFVYGVGSGTLPIKIYASVKVGVSLQVNALCTLMIVIAFMAVAMSQWITAKRKAKDLKLGKML